MVREQEERESLERLREEIGDQILRLERAAAVLARDSRYVEESDYGHRLRVTRAHVLWACDHLARLLDH